MSVDPKELEKFSGKQVIVHVITDDGSVEEKEGKFEEASEVGVAFKEKGKRDVDLLLPEQIEEVAAAPSKPKKLTQKKLKPATESTARQHLADRHGYDLSDLNEMSDEQAFSDHEDIDHTNLGHKHESDEDEADDEAGEDDEA